VIIEVYTCEWGINVFYASIHTCRTRDILRKLHETERDVMMSGSNNININDGDGLYRICITMRTDVVLRSNGDNKHDISDTIYR
jgi:hypothetical protein